VLPPECEKELTGGRDLVLFSYLVFILFLMKIGKLKMFFCFNGLIATALMLYYSAWLFSRPVLADLQSPYYSNTITVQYHVGDKLYTGSYSRYDINYTQRRIPIRYLIFAPSASRVNSFMGMFAEPLGWWLVFIIASAMLLLTNNAVFSKGTMFILKKKFPWIAMEEYFPLAWYEQQSEEDSSPPPREKKNRIKRLGQ
jgi:hypothetical protein